jgi:hypothetical protein
LRLCAFAFFSSLLFSSLLGVLFLAFTSSTLS